MLANDKVVGNLRVFRNNANEISIMDDTYYDSGIITLDECMAEKLCKHIMAVAKEIREVENV